MNAAILPEWKNYKNVSYPLLTAALMEPHSKHRFFVKKMLQDF
jgi:hypothetical protein